MSLCCLQQRSRSFGYCEKLKHKIERHRAPYDAYFKALTVGSSRQGVCCWKASRARRSWSVKLSRCVGRVELVLGYLALGFRCEPHALTVPLERRCIIKEKAFRRNPGYVIIHSHRNKTHLRTKKGKYTRKTRFASKSYVRTRG